MKKAITQSFLWFGFIGLCHIQGQTQTACTNFPVPQITVTIGATMQGSGISIANIPAGATSSLTLVTSTEIPNVLNDVYRAKMQLNGCTSEKLIRHSPNRNIEERYSTGWYRIVHKATGKVLEVTGKFTSRRCSYPPCDTQWEQQSIVAACFRYVFSRFCFQK